MYIVTTSHPSDDAVLARGNWAGLRRWATLEEAEKMRDFALDACFSFARVVEVQS